MKDMKSKVNNKEIQDDTFNMTINSELKKKFNIKCIENNTMMARVLKDFIKEYIEN